MPGHVTYDFEGVTALVTGSTKGIGRGIATQLAEHGADVVVNSRSESDVEDVAAEIASNSDGDAVGVAADLSDPAEIERLVEETVDAFGAPDLLVNNAAVWPEEESMLEATIEDWDFTMNVNVRSQFYCSKLVAQAMVDAGEPGAIVNIASQTGDRRTGGRGLYGVSKTAVNGLTWRMAHDLADHDIRVNAVATDVTESAQLRYEASKIAEEEGRETDDVLREWGAERPIGRLGQPEDIADGVMFLASDRASYVTGTILRVSGGGNLQ